MQTLFPADKGTWELLERCREVSRRGTWMIVVLNVGSIPVTICRIFAGITYLVIDYDSLFCFNEQAGDFSFHRRIRRITCRGYAISILHEKSVLVEVIRINRRQHVIG